MLDQDFTEEVQDIVIFNSLPDKAFVSLECSGQIETNQFLFALDDFLTKSKNGSLYINKEVNTCFKSVKNQLLVKDFSAHCRLFAMIKSLLRKQFFNDFGVEVFASDSMNRLMLKSKSGAVTFNYDKCYKAELKQLVPKSRN